MVDLAGRQVQGCIHGCRKERKPGSHKNFQNLFPIDREVILGQGRFFCAVTAAVFFFFFLVSWQQREQASLVQPGSLELQLEGVAGQGQLDWLLSVKMLRHCLFLAHQAMRRNTDNVPCDHLHSLFR